MNTLNLFGIASLLFCATCYNGHAQQPSSFDEAVIRAMQDARPQPQGFGTLVDAFEASNDATVKAEKWEELVVASSEGILSATWSEPSGGWKLVDFASNSNLTLKLIIDQQEQKVTYTKIIAHNEVEEVGLRGAGALMLTAALDGQQWGGTLILSIAQRSDCNIKRLTYWFTKNFGQDVGVIGWEVDWNAWQQAYTTSNDLGKAIILRNITTLAIRKKEFEIASAINLSALNGTSRELQAIALAFGDPSLGPAVTAKWVEMSRNASDAQMQSLAKELLSKFRITGY